MEAVCLTQWTRRIQMKTIIPVLMVLAVTAVVTACGTNPVTGKKELQFISTEKEIQMGAQAYFPTRQVQGGDYVVNPSVTRYVQEVNNRLAAVSDRNLPFEIEIINSSVPNAWAMPGGKMAINRGLLTELNSEAELAAVLGHEIVHAAARHGAKSQERGMLIQGGMLATQIAAQGSEYGSLIAGGAMLGAQLVTTKYGRGAELESDLYGMEYMHRAGYNPQAAIDLQQTFVRLSKGNEKSWIDGLFASHPPSQERVARNRETANRLGGDNLDYGKERYRKAMAPLLEDNKAYTAADEAIKAAQAKDFPKAFSLINKAIKLQPREPKFYGLKGDLSLNKKQFSDAIKNYDQAIALYPDYFAFHLQQGYAKREQGDLQGALKALEKSNQLLPTPNAQKALGDLALTNGDKALALQYYGLAANSQSAIGQSARVSIAELELERGPGKYIKTRVGLNSQGVVAVLVHNRSPLPVKNVEVVVAYFDERGKQVSGKKNLTLPGSLAANAQSTITTTMTNGQGLRVEVTRAVIIR